jgi:hypothetical protein
MDQAQAILHKLSLDEQARYDRIDCTLRPAFEEGNVNPTLVQSAVRPAAGVAGLALQSGSGAFRGRAEEHRSYELDGHLDANGHRSYAEKMVAPRAIALRARRGRCRQS